MKKLTTKAYNTWDSQAVSDPSTNQARRCLTWQIRRDAVLSTWYGRKQIGVSVFHRNARTKTPEILVSIYHNLH